MRGTGNMGLYIDLHLDGNTTVAAKVWPALPGPAGKPYATIEFHQHPGAVARVYVSSAEQLRKIARDLDAAAFLLASDRLLDALVDIRCLEADLRGESA
jgi:hypothetical protein